MSNLQVYSVGALDQFLTGSPQITFWKNVYKRYSPFALETQLLSIAGDTSLGSRFSIQVPNSGDLLTNVVLEIELPSISGMTISPSTATNVRWVDWIGHALIDSAELDIGGHLIDRQNQWVMDVVTQLSEPEEKLRAYREMVCAAPAVGQTPAKLYIPLKFYFSRSPGNAIPMMSLVYNTVNIHVQLKRLMELLVSDGDPITSVVASNGLPLVVNVRAYADFAMLDTQERERFKSMREQEYLVTQWQMQVEPILYNVTNRKILLNFSNPVTELIWMYVDDRNLLPNSATGNRILDYNIKDAPDVEVVETAQVMFLGVERNPLRAGAYYRLIQPYVHHTRCPDKRIYVYSYALQPDSIQPSGAANHQRIGSVSLNLKFADQVANGRLIILARNYNILRISDGYGALMFSA